MTEDTRFSKLSRFLVSDLINMLSSDFPELIHPESKHNLRPETREKMCWYLESMMLHSLHDCEKK